MQQPTLYDELARAGKTFAGQPFCVERKRFRRKVWTYEELLETADRVATMLYERGLRPGDRVGLCGQNGPWWLAVFIACVQSGLPVVPIDVNSAEDFVTQVVKKTDMKLLVKTVYKPLPTIKTPKLNLEELVELLPKISTIIAPKIEADDMLEIVFTSGSTGDPKGVVLTHRNVVANLQALEKTWAIGRNHRLLSMIPLSHMLEQTVGFLVPFMAGSQVVYVQSVRPFQIIQALQAESITTIVTVPAFLSLLRRRLIEQAEDHHFIKFFQTELKFAKRLPRAVRRYIFQAIFMRLGSDLRLVATGGAALPAELEDFWETLGVKVMQGYGLTETSPIATYSSPRNKRRGSVGRCLPGQKLKLADDGEILLSGDNVFSGYFHNDVETAKVLHDGWYYTGDIGKLDADDYLFITGRKKNMLLTESGLNVYPEDIEKVLAGYTVIRDSVIMLLPVDGKELLTAVVLTTVDENQVAAITREANSKLASHQAIQTTVIWPEDDFPRTPTRKVRRQVVIDQLLNKPAIKNDDVTETASTSQLQLLVAGIAAMPASKIQLTSNLVSDLGFDSLKRLELVSKFEENLGAYVEESAINSSTTYQDLVGMVAGATKAPHAQLINFSFFESTVITSLRVILCWTLLWFASFFQKLRYEPLPKANQPVVYVPNHSSHFDAVTILRMLKPWQRRKIVIGAAQDYFFKDRLQGFIIRLFIPIIPVDREGNIQHTLQQLGTFLDAGFSVVLFPEGTRSTTGKLLPFKPGIGVIAQELDVPVVVIKMSGNETILPKGRHWPKRGTTTVKVTGPYVFGRDGDYVATTTKLEQIIQDL